MSPAPGSGSYFHLLTFKVMVSLHGLAVLGLMLMGTGVLDSVFSPEWLRMPLFVYLLGLACAFLALFWGQWALGWQDASASRKARRWAWIPGFCASFFLMASLGAFLVGTWGTLGLANYAYLHNEWLNSQSDGTAPDGLSLERMSLKPRTVPFHRS